MKLNERLEKEGSALTFTNIVITGQFPILNLSTSWFKNKPCQHCLKLPNINLQIFCVYLSTNISWKLNKQIIAISTFKQFYFRNIRQRNQSQNFSTWSCYPCAEKSQFYRNVLVNFVLVHWCWGAQIPPSKNLPILVTWASIGALFCTRFQQISLSQSSSRSQRIRGKDFLQQWKRESDRVNFCNWYLLSLLMLNGAPYLSHTASFGPSLTVFRFAWVLLLLLLDLMSRLLKS